MIRNTGNRPKIKIEANQFDKFLEMAGWIVLVILWIYVLVNYGRTPDSIPTHFNGAGMPDQYGSKHMFLILPVTATILFIGLTLLNKYPHLFNFPVKITEKNAKQQYALATQMIRFVKFALVVVFSFISYQTQLVAQGKAGGLGTWFLPLILCLVFTPVIIYIVRMFQYK